MPAPMTQWVWVPWCPDRCRRRSGIGWRPSSTGTTASSTTSFSVATTLADRDELTVRGKLRWTPDDRQTWTFSAGLVDADNGYDAFSLDNNRITPVRRTRPGCSGDPLRQRARWPGTLSDAVRIRGNARRYAQRQRLRLRRGLDLRRLPSRRLRVDRSLPARA
jgi:hypothetical protein